MQIDNFCVVCDQISDYVPFVSTATNLIDLFQKTVMEFQKIIMDFREKEIFWASRYYTHLDYKSFLRCIILLIPGIGNILVGIHDYRNRKYNDADSMLELIKQDNLKVTKMGSSLRDNEDFMEQIVAINGLWLGHASERIKHTSEKVAIGACDQNHRAISYVGSELKKKLQLTPDLPVAGFEN